MAGINNETVAKALGMDEKSYRVREERDGRWFAMDASEWFRVVDEQRARRSWSLENATEEITQEMLESTHTPDDPDKKDLKVKKDKGEINIFDASQIVVKRVK